MVVATVRALKMHGVGKIVAGKPLDPALLEENVEGRTGASNLAAHIGIAQVRHPAVVAINAFPTDTPGEVEAIREVALAPAPATPWSRRISRTAAPAPPTRRSCLGRDPDPSRSFKLLYPDEAPLGEKILTIVKEIYGGDGIEPTPAAQKSLKLYESMGFGDLPICMAKTQYSISHDAALKGAPKGSRCRSARSGCRPAPGS